MSRAQSRLSLITRHLDTRLPIKINTPYSAERDAARSKDIEHPPHLLPPPPKRPPNRPPSSPPVPSNQRKMSSSTQAAHPTLLIPGPIEFDDAVLEAMSHYRYVHISRKKLPTSMPLYSSLLPFSIALVTNISSVKAMSRPPSFQSSAPPSPSSVNSSRRPTRLPNRLWSRVQAR